MSAPKKQRIEVPEPLGPMFTVPRGSVQYRCSHGGRGSGKSFTFALNAAIWGARESLRILATRDLQSSIKESFHAELKAAISTVPWLTSHYDVGVDYLRGRNGTEFIFRGLRHNSQAIKSLAKIDLTIVEEAEDITEESWLALEATVFRQQKSELWAIWNPRTDGSPVDKRFIKSPPQNAIITEINHSDNPFFPEGLETLRKRERERLDLATYAHIWEGTYLENSEAQVLHGKVRIAEFEPAADWDGPYFGADWGFAQDPTAAVKLWINDGNLYIEYEAGKVGLELDDTAPFLISRLPGIQQHAVRADSARPETISYLRRNGLPRVGAAKKWAGSVEDGIAHMRSYKEITVHPRCKETIRETRLYSYKKDRQTGDVLPIIVDAHNHYMDATRYALAPLIRRRAANVTGFMVEGL